MAGQLIVAILMGADKDIEHIVEIGQLKDPSVIISIGDKAISVALPHKSRLVIRLGKGVRSMQDQITLPVIKEEINEIGRVLWEIKPPADLLFFLT